MLKKGRCKLTRFRDHPQRLLHDLERDPEEMVNLIDNPGYQQIRQDLEARLERILDPPPMVPAWV